MLDRASQVDAQFIGCVKAAEFPAARTDVRCSTVAMDPSTAIDLFDSQLKSRVLDLMARKLKEQNLSFYTIGSSGHEGNAVLGHVFAYTDMAFLHYRSGAFYLQRAKQRAECDGVQDILLSLVAAASDPISGGRHKVFGSVPLCIPPQTSTIASHLPKALGTALSINRAKILGLSTPLPESSVIMCSFGDASVNHASAQTTFNACSWLASQKHPLPLVFVCEDNGIGISVPTPPHWIEDSMKARPHLHYLACDGLNIADVWDKARQARYLAGVKKEPVFLHLRCVRLLGHAGSDVEAQYQTQAQIQAREYDDPLLHTARMLYEENILSLEAILELYEDNRALIEAKTLSVVRLARRETVEEVMASILPSLQPLPAVARITPAARDAVWGAMATARESPRNLCQNINMALTDLMIDHPNMLIFGEDVGKKGGVYRVTADLQARFGKARVFDSLLDETTILGTAIGLAHNGFLPVPEIQFLAYLHNAEDQLRGEAATLSFFSNGQYRNPMVIRIAALAYQKGFGGHFHNDNSLSVLRDLPGVLVACPSNGADAAAMLRTCVQQAQQRGRVVVFLEPIALYMTKDLHLPGDNGWLSDYPAQDIQIPVGEVGVWGKGDTVILTYANGYYLSRQAARILQEEHGVAVKIVDLRWLSPLPVEAIMREIGQARRVLIVDEGRKSGSISEGIITLLLEHAPRGLIISRLTGEDCFIPLGTAWQCMLPSRASIVDAVLHQILEHALPTGEKQRG